VRTLHEWGVAECSLASPPIDTLGTAQVLRVVCGDDHELGCGLVIPIHEAHGRLDPRAVDAGGRVWQGFQAALGNDDVAGFTAAWH